MNLAKLAMFFAAAGVLSSLPTMRAVAVDPIPPTQPTTSPATSPTTLPAARMGDIEVTVKSASLDFADLQPLGGAHKDEISQDRLLIIRLELHNRGQADVTYKSFNGTEGQKDHASLVDAARHFIALADFGTLEPVGITREATLKPGDTISDVLVFAPPAGKGNVILMLPMLNVGLKGRALMLQVHADIPAN